MNRRQITHILIGAVALHSLILGAFMLFMPIDFLRWMGWPHNGPAFFASQSGIYLLVLGGAYLAGIRYRPFAWFLAISKAAAVLFLLGHALAETAPRILLVRAAVADGLMGLAVVVALISERRRSE